MRRRISGVVAKAILRFEPVRLRKMSAAAINPGSTAAPLSTSTSPAGAGAPLIRLQFFPERRDLRKGLADPRALVLGGLEAARLHELIGVPIPAAVREIMPKHGRG